MTKPWREYERHVHEVFLRRYPDAEILFDAHVPGGFSGVLRQVDLLVKMRAVGCELLGAFDCKHFHINVDVMVVDGVVGFLDDIGADFGGVVSSGGFKEGAVNRAKGARPRIDVRTIPFSTVDDLVDDLAPSGLVYGDGHAFWISPPRGWLIDNVSGRPHLHAVFYPEGGSWHASDCVLYVNTTRRAEGQELESHIAEDEERFREKCRDPRVWNGASLPTADGKSAVVRHFSGDQCGDHETVAYIAEDEVFVSMVLTARTLDSHERGLQALAAVVKSYSFWTKEVRLPPL